MRGASPTLGRRVWGVFATLALVLAACAGDADPTETTTGDTTTTEAIETPESTLGEAPDTTVTTEGEDSSLTIAYIQTGSFDYYELGVQGAEMAAAELGVELIVLNSNLDAEQEIANIEDALVQDVDGIVLFSVGRASQDSALQLTSEAGVPIALLYGYAPELEDLGAVFVQADTAQSGSLVGSWVADEIAEGEVAIIQGALGRGDAESYTESFKEAISANPNLEVVAEPAADWDRSVAVAAMEDILTAHPNLAVVFVQNEDMALGAIQAIETAGLTEQVSVVSQNGSPDGLAAVADGSIAATAAWSPSVESQIALARLVTAIRDGEAPQPKFCPTPINLITAANLDEADPWTPTVTSTERALAADCN